MREDEPIAYSLLGAHVNATLNGLDTALQRWRPPLVVVLDHSDGWKRVKAGSPNTLMVGRVVRSPEPNFDDPALDPLRAARAYCDLLLPWAVRMGEAYDYWQGPNEPAVQSAEAVRRLADFEAERTRLLAGHGFRTVVGSFSVGNPANLAHWRDFLPALEAARQFQGALALHEYAWPTLDHEWPWYLLRHRKVYDGEPKHGWAGLPAHLKMLPLLITECGLDGGIERSGVTRGWRTLYGQDPARYLQQLAWYDAELRKDPYVLGAALYCCCPGDDPQWGSYNIWPELSEPLAEQARPIYRRPQLGEPAEPQQEQPIAPATPEVQPQPAPVVPPSRDLAPEPRALLPAPAAGKRGQIAIGPPGRVLPLPLHIQPGAGQAEASDPATRLQGRITVDKPKVLDQQGRERDWEWLIANMGAIRLEPAQVGESGRQAFRLVQVRAVEGPAALVVHVTGGGGQPMQGVQVVRHWADAPTLPDWPAPTSRWREQGVFGPTDRSGTVGFGLGVDDNYTLPDGGPSAIWVADPAGPSDLVSGLGMVADSGHRHLNLEWQLREVAPAPAAAAAPEAVASHAILAAKSASEPAAPIPAAPSSDLAASTSPATEPVVATPTPPPPPPPAAPVLTEVEWQALVDRLDRIMQMLEQLPKD